MTSNEIPDHIINSWPTADVDWWYETQGRSAEWLGSERRASKLMGERRAIREKGAA